MFVEDRWAKITEKNNERSVKGGGLVGRLLLSFVLKYVLTHFFGDFNNRTEMEKSIQRHPCSCVTSYFNRSGSLTCPV